MSDGEQGYYKKIMNLRITQIENAVQFKKKRLKPFCEKIKCFYSYAKTLLYFIKIIVSHFFDHRSFGNFCKILQCTGIVHQYQF